jgi:uncharacterized protein
MPELWISLDELPDEGKTFSIAQEGLWEEFFTEFDIPAEIAEPIVTSLTARKAPEGVLLEGSLQGTITLPCDRCTEPTQIPVAAEFESFEELNPPEDDAQGPQFLRLRDGELELDAAGFLWQHIALQLPSKVLCKTSCKGLCSKCGADLNQGPCDCTTDDSDPRMAVLRGLKVKK